MTRTCATTFVMVILVPVRVVEGLELDLLKLDGARLSVSLVSRDPALVPVQDSNRLLNGSLQPSALLLEFTELFDLTIQICLFVSRHSSDISIDAVPHQRILLDRICRSRLRHR